MGLRRRLRQHGAVFADSWVYEAWTGPSTLDQIGNGLDHMWTFHPHVPRSVRMQVGIAAAEIAANILEHAGEDDPVRMRMRVRIGDDQVNVCFTDDGRPADVDLRFVYQPDAMAESGRGLAMAMEVLEGLRYRRHALNYWSLASRRFG